jgi:hypothetical protein
MNLLRRVYPNDFSPQRDLPDDSSFEDVSEIPSPIHSIAVKSYSPFLARRDSLSLPSTTFIVIRLPNGSRIYEWFIESTLLSHLYDFTRHHFPKVQFSKFSLISEDGTNFPDSSQPLPFPTTSSTLFLKLEL